MLYLAGYLLGKNDTAAPVQSDGRVVWRPTGADVPGELWTVHEEQVGDGRDQIEHVYWRARQCLSSLARPTGVGRGITTYTIPIEGRDEWLAAARREA